jgi:tetratricopeptide (TPR) repeat protein
MFALAQGTYDVVMIFKNSAAKEFTTAEAEITVPAPPTSLAMSPLFLGYGSKPGAAESRRKAFKFNDMQLLVAPMNQFAPRETMTALVQLLGPEEEKRRAATARFEVTDEGNNPVKTWSLALDQSPGSDLIVQRLDLAELKPALYTMKLKIENRDGKAVLAASAPFSVSAVPVIPRPLVHSEPAPEPSSPFTSFLLGGQYFNKGDAERALELLRDAHLREPANQRYAVGYGRALLAAGRFAEAKDVLEPFREAEKPEAEVFEFLGQAYQALGEYARAVDCYVGYLTRFGSKLAVFNNLGECYSRTGDVENALFAWGKSLEMSPDQPDILQKAEELKKKRR